MYCIYCIYCLFLYLLQDPPFFIHTLITNATFNNSRDTASDNLFPAKDALGRDG